MSGLLLQFPQVDDQARDVRLVGRQAHAAAAGDDFVDACPVVRVPAFEFDHGGEARVERQVLFVDEAFTLVAEFDLHSPIVTDQLPVWEVDR